MSHQQSSHANMFKIASKSDPEVQSEPSSDKPNERVHEEQVLLKVNIKGEVVFIYTNDDLSVIVQEFVKKHKCTEQMRMVIEKRIQEAIDKHLIEVHIKENELNNSVKRKNTTNFEKYFTKKTKTQNNTKQLLNRSCITKKEDTKQTFYKKEMERKEYRNQEINEYRRSRIREEYLKYTFQPNLNPVSEILVGKLERGKTEDRLLMAGQTIKEKVIQQKAAIVAEEELRYTFHPRVNRK